MRDSGKLMCGVPAVLVAVWAAQAGAALVVYGDRAAFEAALTHETTYTFEVGDGFPQAPTDLNPGPPPPLTSWDGGRIQFSGFGSALATVQERRDLSQFSPYNQFLAGVSSVHFSVPQMAIGFNAVGTELAPGNAFITLMFAEAIETRSFIFLDVTTFGSRFFGAISDDPITGFEIDPTVPGISYPWAGIDNVSVQAIPEAGSFMTLVFASGAVLVKRRRR